jgi:antitoxin component of MazEF toxin-antitoxin module
LFDETASVLKTIGKIGNSQGLIFDAALRELTGLKAGDHVNITVHEGGAVVITPMRPTLSEADAMVTARELLRRNSELFKRLA